MTSAQNLRLPSNGNSLFTLLFILLLSSACGKKRQVYSIIEQPKPTTEVEVNTEQQDTTGQDEIVVDTRPEDIVQTSNSSSHNIAVLLPFNSQLNYGDSVSTKSLLALQYYEGLSMALDQLEVEGHHFTVQVFDTGKSSAKTQSILDGLSRDTQLIVGPVFNSNLKIVNKYAKQMGIPVLSPLSPSTKFVENNPFYINAAPSAKAHLSKIYSYLTEEKHKRELVVICDQKGSELELASWLEQLARSGNREGLPVHIRKIVFSDQNRNEVADILAQGTENEIIVTSFNERFVNSVIGLLVPLQHRFQISVFGMPNWINFESVNVPDLATLQFHYTQAAFQDDESIEQQQFENKFKNRTGTMANSYAWRGYDQMYFFGKLLARYGADLMEHLPSSTDEGLYSGFSFFPISKGGFSRGTDYYENEFLHLIRFSQDEHVKVD